MGHLYNDDDRSEMGDLIPVDARRVLDVGCSWGAFGAHLRTRFPGLEVTGVDPSPDAVAKAATRLDGAIEGYFPADLPSDLGPFDVITFNDSLEHFVDPWETLRACQPLLTPTGRVVASIPNIRWLNTSLRLLLRGEWRYEETGMLDRTHLRFFTRSGIQTLFADSGFEIVELYPFNQHTATGRAAAILRLFGHRFDDLLAMHFAVAAVPSSGVSG